MTNDPHDAERTSTQKRFMVQTTPKRHEVFLRSCDYLNVDVHTVLNQAMKDVCLAAIQNMESSNVFGDLSTDEAKRHVIEAFWNDRASRQANQTFSIRPLTFSRT